MIETIKPPTDSLYKFLALVGLLLFVTSVTAPVWIYNKIDEQRIELIRDTKILDAEAEEWQQAGREMDRAGARSDQSWTRLTEAAEKFKDSKLSKTEFHEALEKQAKASRDVYDTTKNLRHKVAEWDKQDAQVQYKTDLLEKNEANARVIRILSSLGAVTGLVFSIVGFSLWYKRAQKYEDAVLRNKAETESKTE